MSSPMAGSRVSSFGDEAYPISLGSGPETHLAHAGGLCAHSERKAGAADISHFEVEQSPFHVKPSAVSAK